jgi:flagellar motility protein MotE (MotC chaperone)
MDTLNWTQIIVASISALGGVFSVLFANKSKGHKNESKGFKTDCDNIKSECIKIEKNCNEIKAEITTKISNMQNQENKQNTNVTVYADTEKFKELENKIVELENQFKGIPKQNKENVLPKSKHKKIWDNLDNKEKECLKPFKKINSIEISFRDINNAVYSGLRKKEILIPTKEISWINEMIPCIVAPEYIGFLKEL